MADVWLVTEHLAFQGQTLYGIFTSRELAEAHVEEQRQAARDEHQAIPELEIIEQPLNTPIDEWMGN